MMYFSRAKTWTAIIICLLGVFLCMPNIASSPAAWLPWRTVRLGLDLQGGSYLLMQVDMSAVLKERLAGLVDSARQELRKAEIFYRTARAEPDQHRAVVQIRDPAKTDAALAALKPLAISE